MAPAFAGSRARDPHTWMRMPKVRWRDGRIRTVLVCRDQEKEKCLCRCQPRGLSMGLSAEAVHAQHRKSRSRVCLAPVQESAAPGSSLGDRRGSETGSALVSCPRGRQCPLCSDGVRASSERTTTGKTKCPQESKSRCFLICFRVSREF